MNREDIHSRWNINGQRLSLVIRRLRRSRRRRRRFDGDEHQWFDLEWISILLIELHWCSIDDSCKCFLHFLHFYVPSRAIKAALHCDLRCTDFVYIIIINAFFFSELDWNTNDYSFELRWILHVSLSLWINHYGILTEQCQSSSKTWLRIQILRWFLR